MGRTKKKRPELLVGLTLLNWTLIVLAVIFTDPEVMADLVFPGSYIIMGGLLFSGIFLLLTIVFFSAKQSIRWTVGIILLLYLRINGLGTILNIFLVIGTLVCVETYLYLIRKAEKKASSNQPTNLEVGS